MKILNKIYGILMRPASDSLENNESIMMSSIYSTDKNFYEKYSDLMAGLQITEECAKIYIEKNWKLIDDWSDLNVIIKDNTKKVTEYYNHIDKIYKTEKSDILTKIMNNINTSDKLKHNPIKTISNVVLDPTDGDFSLDINGNKHLWINGDACIIIADFIENKLKN